MLASYARQRSSRCRAYRICAALFFLLRVFRSSQCDGRAVRGPRAALSITSLWAVSRRLILTCWLFAGSFSGCFLLRRAVERHEHGSGASISGFCGLAVKFAVQPLRRFVGLHRRLSSLAGSFHDFRQPLDGNICLNVRAAAAVVCVGSGYAVRAFPKYQALNLAAVALAELLDLIL